MARVQYGGGVTAFRGSIAGTTFQTTTAGPINRVRSAPRKRTTVKQAAIQSQSFSLLVAWRNLIIDQQAAWNAYALANPRQDKYGTEKLNSGFNAFCTLNANRVLCGNAPLTDPPDPESPPGITLIEFAAIADEIGLDIVPDADKPGTFAAIYLTPPRITAASLPRSALRLVAVEPCEEASHYELTPAWEATFGLTLPPSTPAAFYLSLFTYLINSDTGLITPGRSSSWKWSPV